MRRRKDLTGRKYGRLTATRLITDSKRSAHIWRCDCGNEKEILTINVTSGHVVSCGCYQREISAKNASVRNRKESGQAAFNAIYRNYKARARQRGHEFVINEIQFRHITQQPCYYCGISPQQSWKSNRKKYGDYIHNGIDRVDSSKGYTLDNVVACCKFCNRAKMDSTVDEFMIWVKRIYEHNNT